MNTSKLFVLALFLLISVTTIAQKGSVSKAEAYLNKNDYVNAKAEIDVAITIEKNAGKSKTWFVRGRIYHNIATSEDEAISSLDAEALSKAVEAYDKVTEIDSENSLNSVLAGDNKNALWGNFINAGGNVYGDGDFEGAMVNFEKALQVKPTDSVTLLYAGAAAQQAEKNDKTLLYYYKLYEQGMANMDVYSTLIYLERAVNENDEKALEVVRKAKELFPGETKFGHEEISLLLTLDKIDEAKSRLEDAIAADPSNANLHINLGVLYDNLGSAKAGEGNIEEANAAYENARTSYKNAIAADPENFIGNFNTGVIYVNMAKVYFDEARDMDLKTYQKKGPALEEKGKDILKEALPYLEKSAEIKPDEIDVLRALQQVYSALKMYDKGEAVMNKIDELEGAQ